jgi:hypothetical protein
MRLCLPARMGGGGKAESLPWRGPAGKARHTGAAIQLWEPRGQSPWRSRYSGKRGRSGSQRRHAAKHRHPCTVRRQPDALMANASGHRCCAICAAPSCSRKRETSGRPARIEARAPEGQLKIAAPSGSAAGKSATIKKSRSLSHAPDRYPEGPGLQARFATRIEQVARRVAANSI